MEQTTTTTSALLRRVAANIAASRQTIAACDPHRRIPSTSSAPPPSATSIRHFHRRSDDLEFDDLIASEPTDREREEEATIAEAVARERARERDRPRQIDRAPAPNTRQWQQSDTARLARDIAEVGRGVAALREAQSVAVAQSAAKIEADVLASVHLALVRAHAPGPAAALEASARAAMSPPSSLGVEATATTHKLLLTTATQYRRQLDQVKRSTLAEVAQMTESVSAGVRDAASQVHGFEERVAALETAVAEVSKAAGSSRKLSDTKVQEALGAVEEMKGALDRIQRKVSDSAAAAARAVDELRQSHEAKGAEIDEKIRQRTRATEEVASALEGSTASLKSQLSRLIASVKEAEERYDALRGTTDRISRDLNSRIDQAKQESAQTLEQTVSNVWQRTQELLNSRASQLSLAQQSSTEATTATIAQNRDWAASQLRQSTAVMEDRLRAETETTRQQVAHTREALEQSIEATRAEIRRAMELAPQLESLRRASEQSEVRATSVETRVSQAEVAAREASDRAKSTEETVNGIKATVHKQLQAMDTKIANVAQAVDERMDDLQQETTQQQQSSAADAAAMKQPSPETTKRLVAVEKAVLAVQQSAEKTRKTVEALQRRVDELTAEKDASSREQQTASVTEARELRSRVAKLEAQVEALIKERAQKPPLAASPSRLAQAEIAPSTADKAMVLQRPAASAPKIVSPPRQVEMPTEEIDDEEETLDESLPPTPETGRETEPEPETPKPIKPSVASVATTKPQPQTKAEDDELSLGSDFDSGDLLEESPQPPKKATVPPVVIPAKEIPKSVSPQKKPPASSTNLQVDKKPPREEYDDWDLDEDEEETGYVPTTMESQPKNAKAAAVKN